MENSRLRCTASESECRSHFGFGFDSAVRPPMSVTDSRVQFVSAFEGHLPRSECRCRYRRCTAHRRVRPAKKRQKRVSLGSLSLSLCHTLLLLVSFHYLREGGQEQHGHGQIETSTAHRSNSHVELLDNALKLDVMCDESGYFITEGRHIKTTSRTATTIVDPTYRQTADFFGGKSLCVGSDKTVWGLS